MPEPPRSGEKRQAFISRCISHYVGKEGRKQDQAAAICYDAWRKHLRDKRKK